jgi:hypothetical protein
MGKDNKLDISSHLGLISKAQKASKEHYKNLLTKKKIIEKHYPFFNQFKEPIPNNDKRNKLLEKPIISIDGSNQQINSIGQNIYVPITVARVHLQSPKFNIKLKNIPYFEEIEIIDEEGHAKTKKNQNFVNFYGKYEKDKRKVESSVQSNINFLMLKYETEVINKLANDIESKSIKSPSILFLDGPIMDPPINSLISLIKFRCEAFKKLIQHKVIVVGVTKRVFQKIFLEHLRNSFSTNREKTKLLKVFNDDFDLFNAIFNIEINKDPQRGNIFNIGKLNLKKNSKTYQEWTLYKNEGINFDCCYYLNQTGARVIKLDILYPDIYKKKSNKYHNLIDVINKLTYPRFSIPLPIYLAHEYANIKNETLNLIKKIILNRTINEDPIMIFKNPPMDMYDII